MKRDAYAALGAMALASVLGFWIHPALGSLLVAGMVFYAWHRGL